MLAQPLGLDFRILRVDARPAVERRGSLRAQSLPPQHAREQRVVRRHLGLDLDDLIRVLARAVELAHVEAERDDALQGLDVEAGSGALEAGAALALRGRVAGPSSASARRGPALDVREAARTPSPRVEGDGDRMAPPGSSSCAERAAWQAGAADRARQQLRRILKRLRSRSRFSMRPGTRCPRGGAGPGPTRSVVPGATLRYSPPGGGGMDARLRSISARVVGSDSSS
jgi:hypothetical protein